MGLTDNNTKLIFTRSLNDNLDICSIKLDGSDLKIIKTIPSPYIFSKLYQNKILYSYKEDEKIKLFTFDLENNDVELIIDSEEISAFMELSKDGKLLFYDWDENKFGYVDINSKSVHFLDIDPSKTYNHQWSPDSREIIFVKGQRWSSEEQQELVLFNLGSNERSTLTKIEGEIFNIG